jgi:erythromycin esterase
MQQKNNNPELNENKEIIKAIRDNLINIKTDINTQDNTDLSLLGKYIEDKEIIGLGEATHGTKEFLNMRTRIISYFIKNLGFRTIILEESYSHCLRINSYILDGEGTAEEAVNEGLCFHWVFKTEETLALVKWLREYNITADANSKVRFYGMDFQFAQKAIEVLSCYIKKVDIDNYNKIKADLNFLNDEWNKVNDKKNNVDFEDLENRISAIDKIFIDNKVRYIRNSCQGEYDEVYRCIENYRQWIDCNKNGMTFNLRDKYMFENAKWVIENSKKYNNGKVIIIAHNDHIQKGIVLSEVKNRQLGYLLDIEYKEKYYNIGFEFSRGTFYSKDINDNYKLKIFHVDKNIKNDLAARLFEKTNIPTINP